MHFLLHRSGESSGMTTALYVPVLSPGSVDSAVPKQWKNKPGVGLYTEIFTLQVHVLASIAIQGSDQNDLFSPSIIKELWFLFW